MPAPAAPTGLTATTLDNLVTPSDPTKTGRIRLNWTDNSTDETGFKLERAIFDEVTQTWGTFTQFAQVGASQKTYTALQLVNDRLYKFRVRAFNSTGNSTYSNEAEARTNP